MYALEHQPYISWHTLPRSSIQLHPNDKITCHTCDLLPPLTAFIRWKWVSKKSTKNPPPTPTRHYLNLISNSQITPWYPQPPTPLPTSTHALYTICIFAFPHPSLTISVLNLFTLIPYRVTTKKRCVNSLIFPWFFPEFSLIFSHSPKGSYMTYKGDYI